MRVAVIGAGDFGTRHLAGYRSLGAEVVAVVDPDPAARARVTRSGPGAAGPAAEVAGPRPAVYPDVTGMLARERIDAASVCTPGSRHREVAEELLAAEVPVLVEKPLADTAADAVAIARAAAAAGVVCQPGHLLRFSAPHLALYEDLRAGRLGRVLAVSARRDRPRTLSRLFPHDHPALLTAVHDIDLALWYAGAPVESVRAVAHTLPGAGTPALVWAELRHANGVVSSVRNSYLLPENAPHHTHDLVEVYGTAGIGHVDFGHPMVLVQDEQARAPDWLLSPSTGGGALAASLRHFLARVAGASVPDRVPLADGVAVVQIAAAIVDSAAAGGAPGPVPGIAADTPRPVGEHTTPSGEQ